jgi:hypothetical protein
VDLLVRGNGKSSSGRGGFFVAQVLLGADSLQRAADS